MISKECKMYIDEMKDCQKYKKLNESHPEHSQYFTKMQQDEETHARYILQMYPHIEEEVEELKELLEYL